MITPSFGSPEAFTLQLNCKKFFFDTPRVMAAVSQHELNFLRHFGGYVRKVARNSIKDMGTTKGRRAVAERMGNVSAPGDPPFSHTGLLKGKGGAGGIWFVLDPAPSAVIGPVVTHQIFFSGESLGRPMPGIVPAVLEFGGKLSIFEVRYKGPKDNPDEYHWHRADLRSRQRIARMEQRFRTVHIKARPYMGPAFEAGLEHQEEFWNEAYARAAG